MNSVHIPSNGNVRVVRVETCGTVCLYFANEGEFSWTGAGRQFNPRLPQRRVEGGKLGPFIAPNHEVKVHWKFIQSPSGEESDGLIEVVSRAESKEDGNGKSSEEEER